jgi:hypothetical protein
MDGGFFRHRISLLLKPVTSFVESSPILDGSAPRYSLYRLKQNFIVITGSMLILSVHDPRCRVDFLSTNVVILV